MKETTDPTHGLASCNACGRIAPVAITDGSVILIGRGESCRCGNTDLRILTPDQIGRPSHESE